MSEAEAVSGAAVMSGEAEQSAAPDMAEATGNTGQWYGDLDESAVGFIENKGWKDVGGLLTSYQNLEKAVGKERLAIPSNDDGEGWNELYNKLGRPETSDLYKFNVPEGVENDEQMTSWFKENAHKAGLTQAQASMLFESWNEMAGGITEAKSSEMQAKAEADIQDLKKEWGLAYDAKVNSAKRAAQKFGFSQDELSGIEQAIGTRGLMEKFADIGKALGEDSFESSEGSNSFVMTPGQAQARIGELKSDPQWQKTYLDPNAPGHREAVEKYTQLMKAAYPG